MDTLAKADPSIFSGLTSRRRSYAGIVGNGYTCALIDARARVGWLCLPTFAQFPVFATLLDPVRGGCLDIGIHTNDGILWSSDYGEFQQRYLSGTNVLETDWLVAAYRIIIRDTMPWSQNLLVRDIRIENGSTPPTFLVRMRLTNPLPPSTRFEITQNGIVIEETRCAATGRLFCTSETLTNTVVSEHAITYELAPRENRVTLKLSYTDGLKPQTTNFYPAQDAIQICAGADREWLSGAVRLDLPDTELNFAFDRALLTLRMLTYEPTGAILAAATASFPSEIGGPRNWDYRYCWVRDGCYTARAFDLAGCHQEAERLHRFLLDREANGQWVSPLWAIEPDYPTDEEEVAGL